MSRVVKNSRRWSPRARWKIEAPCITVLSTSKNAADVGSASTLSALSTSATAAAASPASCERRCRFAGRGVGLRRVFCRHRLLGGGGVTAHPRPYDGAVLMCETRPMESNVAELVSRAAAQEPDKTALSEAASGRTVTWSGLDDLVQRVVQGLSDAGMVAGYRVMIAAGNSIEFVAAYLGALRAGMVVVPVNPRSATGELMRMLADSGTRMVIADASTIATVREAVGGLRRRAGGRRASSPARARASSPSAPPWRRVSAAGTSWSRRLGGPAPGARRPRVAGRAALHERHVRPAARRDAVPPGAARQHRAGGRRSTRR